MPETEKPVGQYRRKGFRRKRYIFPLAILFILVAFRLYLPTLIKNRVTKVLTGIPGYYGQVDDVDIALFRGAYSFKGMMISEITAQSPHAFLNLPKSEISIEWKSLVYGKFVSTVILDSPEITYLLEDDMEKSVDTSVDDLINTLSMLVPIEINHIEIRTGKLAFVQLSAKPEVNLQITQIELTADNLRSIVEKERILPSPIQASGISSGNGKVFLEGNMNLSKKIPDIDLYFSLENADVTALNSFTNHNAKLDFAGGKLNVFSEVTITNGNLIGYVKPLLTDLKLIGRDDTIPEDLWEGFAGFFNFILKNKEATSVMTKVPIAGDLKNSETGLWFTVNTIFKNGWIQAFTGPYHQEINYEDALKNPKLSKKERRELEKLKRQSEIDQRKKQQQIKKG